MKIFLCEDSLEGIFTGIYDAWARDPGHGHVRLSLKDQYEPELFAEYEEIEPDDGKSEKVARSIQRKISGEAFRVVCRAAFSVRAFRADAIYRFLIEGFRYGSVVLRRLQNPAVAEVFALSRKVANEAHQYLEFIRFEQLANGVLFAAISPKSRVSTLVAPHFADRFPGENWVIYDDVREEAAIHGAGEDWITAKIPKDQADAFLEAYGSSDHYEDLWKTFFHSIGIRERENPNCQRNFLPVWYRKHMTEFL
ncbi:MAG: DNA metabolism protein [Lachnospiraceae bacterium]|nr:DNA metabolism protein [Lachnospiraceae bacterium]